ncbi:MAG TPA: hypothetical protein VM283_07840 [Armatimonadota bacterium]|nr:hypothetical protein [Armatimonadota bacterium]
MSRHTLLIAALLALVPVSVWAQFGATGGAAAQELQPCMIVGGRALAPVAFVEGMAGLQNSPTVTLDGVEMAYIGAGAKAGGGRATIAMEDAVKVLEISMAGQRFRFEVLSPGNFWMHSAVRELIPRHRLQVVPRWPHVDTTFPSTPPFGVNWKRPYLDWQPDEAWLRMMLAPPPPPQEEVVPVEPTPKEGEGEAAAAPAPAPAPAPGPPPGMMGAPGEEPPPP